MADSTKSDSGVVEEELQRVSALSEELRAQLEDITSRVVERSRLEQEYASRGVAAGSASDSVATTLATGTTVTTRPSTVISASASSDASERTPTTTATKLSEDEDYYRNIYVHNLMEARKQSALEAEQNASGRKQLAQLLLHSLEKADERVGSRSAPASETATQGESSDSPPHSQHGYFLARPPGLSTAAAASSQVDDQKAEHVAISRKLKQADIPVHLTLFDSAARFEQNVDELIEKTVGEFKVTEVHTHHGKLLRQVFGMVRMDAVVAHRPVVTVDERTPVGVALARMTAEKVSSLIVTGKEGSVVGVVTSQDVLFYTLDLLRGDQDRVDALYAEEHISKLLGCAGREHWRPFAGADSLLKALLALSGEAHRLCIVDEMQKFAGFVSQIDLVRVFAEHPALLGPRHNQSVISLDSLMRPRREIFAVGHDIPVWQAFDVIRKKNLSAVAVLDRSDVIQGEISLTHMRGISYENFHMLLMNIDGFMALRDEACPSDCVILSCECSVVELVKSLASHSAHRAWLRDPIGRLKGLVTLTDFLTFIVHGHTPPSVQSVEKKTLTK